MVILGRPLKTCRPPPIKQWPKGSEAPQGYSPWVIRPRWAHPCNQGGHPDNIYNPSLSTPNTALWLTPAKIIICQRGVAFAVLRTKPPVGWLGQLACCRRLAWGHDSAECLGWPRVGLRPLRCAGSYRGCLAGDTNAARVCGWRVVGMWCVGRPAAPPPGGWGQTQAWVGSCRVG